MPDDLVRLSVARAHRENDNTLWTVADALRDLADQIDREEVNIEQLVMIYTATHADGRALHTRLVNVDRANEIALLDLAHHQALHDWYG